MRVSEKWLREWVNPDVPIDRLCDQLTNAGLEVDSVDVIEPKFSDVVVGEVASVDKHPNSERLTVCNVATGDGEFTVVCGAPNVRKGLKSAYAKVGAVLPGNRQVAKASIKGVDSEGMLCSSAELGVDEDHVGILELDPNADVGGQVAESLKLPDNCIELDLTPNRGDCFSIRGVARELAVINEMPVNTPTIEPSAIATNVKLSIDLEAPEGCPVYLGKIIEDVDVNAQVPLWMARRLHASGVRSINAIVDILNYVMIELGQPMHAFDLEKVRDGIVVRYANSKEKMTLLDGTEAELDEDVLVIASSGAPVAIAGVIGGMSSGVSDSTQSVLLECAYFSPTAIAGTARKYGLQTDASTRYERGVDYALQDSALERATSLILDIAGGSAGPVIEARSPRHVPTRQRVTIHKERLDQLIGENLPDDVVYGIFERLGFEPEEPAEYWTVTAPTHRFDIEIEEDLVEEVCRIYGYDRIGMRLPVTPLNLLAVTSATGDASDLRSRLRSMGYSEAITYSFIGRSRNDMFSSSDEIPILQNPMSSDREVMRCSLLPGLLDVVSYNGARQHSLVRVFEYGQCFNFDKGQLIQEDRVAGAAWGVRHPENWTNGREPVDFFDVKGHVEALLPQGVIEFRQSKKHWVRPGHGADIFVDGIEVGSVGQVQLDVQAMFDIEEPVFGFEFVAKRLKDSLQRKSKQISTHPSVRRDLALILDESITIAQIRDKVAEVLGERLTDFTVFDVYRGEQFGDAKKSVAIGMTLQETARTLLDSEANECIELVISELETAFGAQLR